jgi:hypothetical protein
LVDLALRSAVSLVLSALPITLPNILAGLLSHTAAIRRGAKLEIYYFCHSVAKYLAVRERLDLVSSGEEVHYRVLKLHYPCMTVVIVLVG